MIYYTHISILKNYIIRNIIMSGILCCLFRVASFLDIVTMILQDNIYQHVALNFI